MYSYAGWPPLEVCVIPAMIFPSSVPQKASGRRIQVTRLIIKILT